MSNAELVVKINNMLVSLDQYKQEMEQDGSNTSLLLASTVYSTINSLWSLAKQLEFEERKA